MSGYLYLPRVHCPLPQSGPHCPRSQLGRPGRLTPRTRQARGFLPISGRLYFRESQLPIGPEGILEFHTKCELAVTLLREQARIVKDKHLAVFDGGYALESVVRPLVLPEEAVPRIEFLTRLRCNARLYALPPSPEQRPHGKRTETQMG